MVLSFAFEPACEGEKVLVVDAKIVKDLDRDIWERVYPNGVGISDLMFVGSLPGAHCRLPDLIVAPDFDTDLEMIDADQSNTESASVSIRGHVPGAPWSQHVTTSLGSSLAENL
ncbi:unnamed protein product [Symbiodinium necroappetens]|uniref:Uncharacterized protein n=1 Tax=Symbiodinium necroappetens TaxID=1628268 RepID=A0A812Y3K8_9DINO|nr:unnamed protein product [Symbiodinium necroappetens]